MKKVLLGLALAVAASGTPAAYADGEAFVSINGGHSAFEANELLTPPPSGLFRGTRTSDFDRHTQAFGLTGGYRWSLSDTVKLGIEGGYVDLGDATAHYTSHQNFIALYVDDAETRREKARAALVGFNGRWAVARVWSLTARGGLARYRAQFASDTTSSISGGPPVFGHDPNTKTSTSFYYGASLGYDILPHLSLAASIDRFAPHFAGVEFGRIEKVRVHVTVSGLRAEYRFD